MNYSRISAGVAKTLARAGREVIRRAFSGSSYDTETGTNTQASEDTTRLGVKLPFGIGVTYVRGQQVVASDQRLLLDANGPVAPTDHFVIGGEVFTVVSFEKFEPADTAVLYDIHLRRG